jgi:ABC-type sugar transport system substrate-binding protein
MKIVPRALVAMLGLAAMPASLEVPKVLAAGSETTAKPGLPKYRFAVITHSTAVAFFVPIRKGAEDAGQVLGAEVTYTGPPDFNIQKQVDFIKSAIAQNVDGIATTMPDPTAFNAVVKESTDRGIPLIALKRMRPRVDDSLTLAKTTMRRVHLWERRSLRFSAVAMYCYACARPEWRIWKHESKV